MIRKILLHIAKNPSTATCWETSLVCSKYSWGIWGKGGVETPGKCVILTLTKAWKHYFQHLNCQIIFI